MRGITARCCTSKSIRNGRERAAALLAAGASCAPLPCAAHGFGQRFDLPLPLWLWLTGAGATIVVTFAAIALFVREHDGGHRYPRVDLMRWAPIRALVHPVTIAFIRLVTVALFALTVAAGLFGNQSPYANLIPTMVWVVWWVGFAFVCALIGDAWALVNPFRTLFAWAECACAALTRGRRLSQNLGYPRALGVWPAVALYLAFIWVELVWRNKDVPASLACAVLAYGVVTWMGMFLYGRDTWRANGEAFSIAFGVFGRFAPLGAPAASRDRNATPRLELRPLGAGLTTDQPVSVSLMAFVLLMLAGVTYDGFQQTPLMQRIETAIQGSPTIASWLFSLSEWGIDETQAVQTAALIAFPLMFVAIFLCACRLMIAAARRWSAARPPTLIQASGAFVLTLVPIAVAYHLSHYFSLLLTAGQFIIPLASDPFGFGWDLFGTAKYKVDFGIVSPYVFWYGAVAIIVIGHVIAVFLAHHAALRMFGSRSAALASQVPMVALMVAYTTLSLWILAQPIVG